MSTIQKKVRNDETSLAINQREMLTYDDPLLVPCEMESTPDDFTLSFQTDGLDELASHMKKMSKTDKYRFLSNCAELERLGKEYTFSLDPTNIYYDYNLLPQVLMRNITQEPKPDFLTQYKALAGAVLFPRYKYIDFYEGGQDLFKKRKQLRTISEKTSTDELQTYLMRCYFAQEKIIKDKKTQVNKSSAFAVRIIIPLLIAGVIGLGVKLYLSDIKTIPLKNACLNAEDAYLRGAYSETIDDLKNYSYDQLPYATNYILARSYIQTSNLEDRSVDSGTTGETNMVGAAATAAVAKQDPNNAMDFAAIKQAALEFLNYERNVDERYVKLWYYIGREQYDQAIKMAKSLDDDTYLLMAYAFQQTSLDTDTTMDGDEKDKKLENIDKEIKAIKEKQNAAEEDNNAATTSTATGNQPAAGATTSAAQ